MKTARITLIIFFQLYLSLFAQENNGKRITGQYLGMKSPGYIPTLFAPEIVTEVPHSSIIFSPDGKEMYYVPWSTLRMQVMVLKDYGWEEPNIVPFAEEYDAENSWLSTDGTRLFFTSTRLLEAQKIKQERKFWGENIWYVNRQGNGWSEPIPLSNEVNSFDLHWQFSIDGLNNDLYFSASTGEMGGSSDI